MEKTFQEQLNQLKSQAQPQKTQQQQQVSQGKEKMEEEFKPLHYDVSYSSVSSYKDGKRDVKEKFHYTNPETEIVAERVPGKDEFKVKTTSKIGDKPETKEETWSGAELKRHLDKEYKGV
jgi:NAD+--asparagine ADP-ribosyltransferase